MITIIQSVKMSNPATEEFMVGGDVYEATYSIEGLTGSLAWEAFCEIYSLKQVNADGSKDEVHPEDEGWIKESIAEQCRVHNFCLKDREYSKEYKAEMMGDEGRGN